MTSKETALNQNQIYFSKITMHGNREEMEDFKFMLFDLQF